MRAEYQLTYIQKPRAIKKKVLAWWFSVKATIRSLPWLRLQKHHMKRRANKMPGKKSQIDLRIRDTNTSSNQHR
jgi:hypothetical protein